MEGERAGLPFCQTRGVRIWLFRHGQQVSQSLQPLYPKAWQREPGEESLAKIIEKMIDLNLNWNKLLENEKGVKASLGVLEAYR